MTTLLFQNFTSFDWFLVVLGCVLFIIIPSIFILIIVKVTSAAWRFCISQKDGHTVSKDKNKDDVNEKIGEAN